MVRWPVVACVAALSAVSLPARAQTGGDDKPAEPAAPKAEPPPNEPIERDEKRELPDYDGREDTTSAGEAALWVPRVLLSPIYFVTEYLLRRPLGALVTVAEEEQLYEGARDLFTFGPDNNIAVIPTFLFDFGFLPSVGVFGFWNDFLTAGNDLRLRSAYGFDGLDWWAVSLADRITVAHDEELTLRASYDQRSDYLFQGLGPSSSSQQSRYSATIIEGGMRYDAGLTGCTRLQARRAGSRCRTSRVRTHVLVRDVHFRPGQGAFDDPTVAQQIDRGRLEAPPALDTGYTALISGVELVLDSRARRFIHVSPSGKPLPDMPEVTDHIPPPGTGVRFDLRGEHGAGLGPSLDRHYEFVRYGATLGGFLDLTGTQRTLGLQVAADFADPLASSPDVPFTEQIQLGGARLLRGFREGRLVGRSAAAVQLEYTYPVWVWLDGALHYGIGNVFNEHLEDFEPGLLRQSFGFGFRTNNSPDNAFELLLAFGSRTFNQGGGLERVRFVLGTTSGF